MIPAYPRSFAPFVSFFTSPIPVSPPRFSRAKRNPAFRGSKPAVLRASHLSPPCPPPSPLSPRPRKPRGNRSSELPSGTGPSHGPRPYQRRLEHGLVGRRGPGGRFVGGTYSCGTQVSSTGTYGPVRAERFFHNSGQHPGIVGLVVRKSKIHRKTPCLSAQVSTESFLIFFLFKLSTKNKPEDFDSF